MNKLPDKLTKEEELELKEIARQIFGASVFLVVDKTDRNKPEFKRYEELMSKKLTFLAAENKVMRQMMHN
jgi:hypothetical protein